MMRHLVIATAFVLTGCAPAPADTIREVEAFGFSDVELTGYRWFGCGKDDVYHEGFVARNAAGARVEGVVCSAPLKGATVRLTS